MVLCHHYYHICMTGSALYLSRHLPPTPAHHGLVTVLLWHLQMPSTDRAMSREPSPNSIRNQARPATVLTLHSLRRQPKGSMRRIPTPWSCRRYNSHLKDCEPNPTSSRQEYSFPFPPCRCILIPPLHQQCNRRFVGCRFACGS